MATLSDPAGKQRQCVKYFTLSNPNVKTSGSLSGNLAWGRPAGRPGGTQWPWLKSWWTFTLSPLWMRWPKMIIANPADRGHASLADEAWCWGLARRPEHMGVGLGGAMRGLPSTRLLDTERTGREREDPDALLQWLWWRLLAGSTPSYSLGQVRQGNMEKEYKQPPVRPKTLEEFDLPWVLFILPYTVV